ncbi:hypothetical protein LTS07_007251 [Exophiala sideris]|nr:hypothetical protein LTS07_007251 [Exophiala sideris]KAK5033956.1 hypothetical protein LTR13_006556 [Exophiala sideris]
MSDFIPDPGAGFERLTSKYNYNRWARGFKTVAKLKGVWSLINGEEKILGKSFLYGCHPEGYDDDLRSICKSCFRHTQLYTAQNVRVQTALGLLEFWVEPDIRYAIETYTCPRAAWLFLEDHYKLANERARIVAEVTLTKLRLHDCKNMTDYLREHHLLRADI